jgi:hypothetical protein
MRCVRGALTRRNQMTKKLTPGARVAVLGQDMKGRETQTPARVVRRDPMLKGWWLVQFDTQSIGLVVNESRLRVAA